MSALCTMTVVMLMCSGDLATVKQNAYCNDSTANTSTVSADVVQLPVPAVSGISAGTTFPAERW